MSRVALDLGFIQIYWYSIFIFLGVLVGLFVVFREVRRQKINEDFMINLLFYGIIIGLIGARLYYVLFNLDYYTKYPLEIFEIWNGGLAIHGGIIAAIIWIFFYTRKYKAKTMKVLDILAPGLMIGQSIGRWGNFFNGEAFGAITTRAALEKLQLPDFIIEGMKIDGYYRTPTFLYESIWTFFGFLALLLLRRYKYVKTGQLTGFYFMWYSVGRFFVEGMRTDSLMLGSFRIAQIVSIVLFIIGLLLFIFSKKGSRFDNLYKEKEKNEIRF